MEDVQFKLNGDKGSFFVTENDEQLGEMVVSETESALTVYHTEVSDKAEGKGLAKKMFQAMVEHAREQHLQVIPLCTFVQAQLKRSPDSYSDIWQPKSNGGQ